MLWALAFVAAMGWSVAGFFYSRVRQHRCPIEPATKVVLLNSSGLPESCRALRGDAPKTYRRPHGSLPDTIYQRAGTALLYQATAPRQPK